MYTVEIRKNKPVGDGVIASWRRQAKWVKAGENELAGWKW